MYVWPQYREKLKKTNLCSYVIPRRKKQGTSHRLYAAATFAELAV